MINKRFKRFLSMLMCMVVMVTSPCTSVFAYEDSYVEELFEDGEEIFNSFSEDELGDAEFENDELFAGYMFKEAEALVNDTGEENIVSEEAAGTYVERGSLLSGNEKICYDVMKETIARIAAGKTAETKIYIPVPKSLLKDYTAEMLGVECLYENGSVTAEATAAMKAIMDVDMKKVVRSLLLDMPYELYWFDKVSGYSMARCVSYKYKNENDTETLNFAAASDHPVPAWRFSLIVAESYRKTASEKYIFNTELAQKAGTSAAKAAADVITVTESVSSDYAKLKAYQKLIQGYSAYNSEAVNTSGYPYGDPWQMIYVFDDDPSTTVVCEGFSKAFKFMCDLSSFAGDIDCCLVSGYLNGPSGNHMWNNVRMENGKYYLTDITNSRSASAVNFLGGAEYKPDKYITKNTTADGTYISYAYSCGSNNYYYDKFTMNLYDDELTYSTTAYDPAQIKYTNNITLSMNYADGGRQIVCVYKNEDSRDRILNINPFREGYSFDGWYTESEGGEALADKDKLTVSDNTAVLYAHWSLLPRYEVTAHSGNGEFSDANTILKAEMYEGKKYYDVFEIPVYDAHHDFTGWYESESCSDNSLIKENDVFTTERSRDIYAGWKLKKYKLTLYPCGGEFYDGGTKGKALTYNALSRLSNPAKYTPVKAGYDFEGWYTLSEGGEEYDISQPIEQNITVYAHWKEVKEEPDPETETEETISDNKPDTPSENEIEKNDTVSVNGFYACFYDDAMYKDKAGVWHAVYNGGKLTPKVRVYDNKQLLTEGVDYTLRYVNNIKAYEVSGRTAYAEIKGKGNMKGTYRLDFVIDRLGLQSVSVGSLCVKSGSESKASPTLIYNGRLLKKNKDYTYKVQNGNVLITGTGNCCGEVSAKLISQDAGEYSKKTIKVKLNLPKFTYDGKEKRLKSGSELIVTTKDGTAATYTVSYSDNINAGTVKLIVCGTGDCHGVIKKTFRIKPVKAKGADAFDIICDKNALYKKGGAKPGRLMIKCKATGETLREGADFRCIYSNYKKSGKAKIKFKFAGNYKGSSYPATEYEIEKRSLENARVFVGDMAFTTAGKYRPKVVVTCGGSLVDPKEYNAEYPANSKINEPKENLSLTVAAREKNYTGGTKSVSYNITYNGIDVNKAGIIYKDGADKQYYEGFGESVTLIPGRDFAIRINKDITIDSSAEIERGFDIIYADNTGKGTAYMILVPKTDKYAGIIKASFKIKPAKITDLIE